MTLMTFMKYGEHEEYNFWTRNSVRKNVDNFISLGKTFTIEKKTERFINSKLKGESTNGWKNVKDFAK